MIEFARQHDLIYFASVRGDDTAPIIRGSTAAGKYTDNSFCIGTHAGYDMALVDRTNVIAYDGYKTTLHRWFVMQIDLRKAVDLPYIFIGTRQQTKAFYARVLMSRRELRYMNVGSAAKHDAAFHSHYAVIASPSQIALIYKLLDHETINILGAHKYPYAIEIEGNSLYVITEAARLSKQTLNKLLHFSLWMAKEIDERLV